MTASRFRLADLLPLMFQHRFDYCKNEFLLTGRSVFPECFNFPDPADFISIQIILEKIIGRNMQGLTNIYEYRQTWHLCTAFNLPEISGIDIA